MLILIISNMINRTALAIIIIILTILSICEYTLIYDVLLNSKELSLICINNANDTYLQTFEAIRKKKRGNSK